MNLRRLNPFRRKKIAISFRGGGARCMAYIGVLKALEENGIFPDMLIGSSAGTAVIGAYACGKSFDEMVDYSEKFSLRKNTDLDSIRSFNILDREKLEAWGRELVGDVNIEDLKVPVYIQVTNMDSRKYQVIDEGSLCQWSTASCAFPFLMDQYEIDGVTYGDGDLTATHDAGFLRAKGADVVLGFSVSSQNADHPNHKGIVERLEVIMTLLKTRTMELGEILDPCDMTTNINLPKEYGILDFQEVRKVSEFGYKETMKVMDRIKELI